jgi:ATP/maltotriose-dependent transcriptional regulator MalT
MDILEYGRACYERRAWGDAYQALRSADDAATLGPDDLERLACAAYLTGRDLEFQRTLERLHAIYADARDREGAARCAFWLALLFANRGDVGQSNAWIARGQQLVGDRDCVERGYVLLPVAELQLRLGDTDAAHATCGKALGIGKRFEDADLTAAALHGQGRALIDLGRVPAGLKCLDETMLAVVADELSPIMTGLMYCSVIDVCRQIYALARAREWTAALSRVCETQPDMVAFSIPCLVRRAEIKQFHGAWPDAFAEASLACERAERADRRAPGSALYQQAEIHRLCGDFAKAENAYRLANDSGYEPQPGVALLRLAQGRKDAAHTAIRRLMSATSNRLRRARLLPAHLEIMLAIGDVDEARRARNELSELAGMFDSDVLRAIVAQGDGAIALAENDARAALEPLRHAFELWNALESTYEAARVRVLIAAACGALGDDDCATLEREAARAVFTRLGARPDLAGLDATATPNRRAPDVLTTRELQVLRLISTGRTNKEIASDLRLSARTIDRHVSNILGKLEVPSRAAATAYAYNNKLL